MYENCTKKIAKRKCTRKLYKKCIKKQKNVQKNSKNYTNKLQIKKMYIKNLYKKQRIIAQKKQRKSARTFCIFDYCK